MGPSAESKRVVNMAFLHREDEFPRMDALVEVPPRRHVMVMLEPYLHHEIDKIH